MTSTLAFGRRAGLAAFTTLLIGAMVGGGTLIIAPVSWASEHRSATVYRSPSCGCCGAWVDYLESHGYQVVVEDVEDPVAVKELVGVPEELYSCHTAAIDGYTIEGHVPIEAIERLLAERPQVQGIGVAGMPPGSPGMGGPIREPFTAYTFRGGEVGEPFMTFPITE